MKNRNRSLVAGGLLGIVLLTASVAGSWMVLHGHASNGKPAASKSGSLPRGDERSAVCIGYVDVETGVTPLYPVRPGRVEKVEVKENETVKAGQKLLSLDRRAAEYQERQAQADLTAAKAQTEQARKGVPRQELRDAQQQAAIDAVRQKLVAAEAMLARREELQNIQQVSSREIEASRAQTEELKAVLRAEEKKLEELRLNDPKLDVIRAEADVQAKEAQWNLAKLAVDECDLKAPGDGIILRVLVSQGEVLGGQPKQPAILFCPEGPRIIRAEVEQEFVRRVAIGQKAEIHDDTISGERWTGQVETLSDWFTHRRSIIIEPLQFNDVRTLECIVQVDEGQEPLRIGQRVRVVIGREIP